MRESRGEEKNCGVCGEERLIIMCLNLNESTIVDDFLLKKFSI